MIPVVGNHIVRLGNADNLDQKFYRLLVFYRQVMSKTGFDKYKVVDVQYDGQVLASKKPENNNVDSVQLRKNVEKLLHEAQQAEEEADAQIPVQTGPSDSSTIITNKVPVTTKTKGNAVVLPVKKTVAPKVTTGKAIQVKPKEKTTNKNEAVKTPKAVMPKKINGTN